MRTNSVVIHVTFLVMIAVASATGPVKVFLLAGQSNMEGMGSLDHLDILVNSNGSSTASNEFRDALWNGTAYIERDDVYIKYDLDHGKLTVSRTKRYAGSNSFGPEAIF